MRLPSHNLTGVSVQDYVEGKSFPGYGLKLICLELISQAAPGVSFVQSASIDGKVWSGT
jgi:hypothetical protein